MRIRTIVALAAVLFMVSVGCGLACDYEVSTNFPSAPFVCANWFRPYYQQLPHSNGTGVAFKYNLAMRGARIRAYAGWSTSNPPPNWFYISAYYSDGTVETVYHDNLAWEFKVDSQGNPYYEHYMTNHFSAPQGCIITQAVIISTNDNPDAGVVAACWADTDGDKLCNAQETGQTKTSTNLWDTDGDGLSDGEEVRTATNPTNAMSFFAFTGITNTGSGNLDLSWPSTNGKSYRLDVFFDPVSLVCSTVQDGVSGAFPTNVLSMSISETWTTCYYRVIQTTDSVTGRNAVGFTKILGERDKLTLGRSDFEDLTSSGGVTVAGLFGDQLPESTLLYLWNRSSATYNTLMKTRRGGWGMPGTTRVARGEGFWIRVPGTAVSNEYPVRLIGQIPDRMTAPSTVVQNITGVNMLGFPYPVQEKWTNTDIAKKTPGSSTLYLWDQSNQVYMVYSKSARGSWGSMMSNVVLNPGQGFWLRNTDTFDWVESKPYTWP